MALGGNLILDDANDPHSVFIFQIGSTPTTASASSITFIRGAQACNVFLASWFVRNIRHKL